MPAEITIATLINLTALLIIIPATYITTQEARKARKRRKERRDS